MPTLDWDNQITSAEARRNLAKVLDRVAYGRERVVLSRRGRPEAVLVSLEDLLMLQQMDECVARDAVREAETAAAREDEISWEALEQEVGDA